MNGLTIICAKGGKLLYHKAFTKGVGIQEEFIDPLILGGVFYTLWCSSTELCAKDDTEKSLDLVFPEKQTRLCFAESNDAIWVISMKSIVSSKTARHILDQAMQNWKSFKDDEDNSISDGTIARPEMRVIKQNFIDVLRNFGQELLDNIFRQDGGMQCLVVWGPPFFRGGFRDIIPVPPKKSIFNCVACMRIEEPRPKYKSVYLDCQNSPTDNGQSQLRKLVEQRVMPNLDFEELLIYSREPGCHYTAKADLPEKGKKKHKDIWYIVIGDLLVFLALNETRDINGLLSKNWSDVQELEAIMNFTIKQKNTSNVSTH